MSDPLTAGLYMAAPGALDSLGKMFRKTPQQKISSDTTAYLNKLRNVSKEGLYGQDVKNEIGTDIAQASNNTQNAIRSTAVKQGIENSGVVAQQLIKEGGQTTLQAAKMAKQIAKMNEESKLAAGREAATVGQSIEDIKYNNSLLKMQRKDDIYGGLFDAASTGISGFMEADALKTRNTQLSKILSNPKLAKAFAKAIGEM